jgi:hypothetical protein
VDVLRLQKAGGWNSLAMLRNPVFTDAAPGGLATFDCVIAKPPFSLEHWKRKTWENDPWGRTFVGLPTDSSGDADRGPAPTLLLSAVGSGSSVPIFTIVL